MATIIDERPNATLVSLRLKARGNRWYIVGRAKWRRVAFSTGLPLYKRADAEAALKIAVQRYALRSVDFLALCREFDRRGIDPKEWVNWMIPRLQARLDAAVARAQTANISVTAVAAE